jgi:hypothetical protein
MFSVAFDHQQSAPTSSTLDPRAQEIARIIELRNRVVGSRDLLYCSAEIRRLIEEDLMVLIGFACAKK